MSPLGPVFEFMELFLRILTVSYLHRHSRDKYLDTLLANQTARKVKPPTKQKGQRKMADCPSCYLPYPA